VPSIRNAGLDPVSLPKKKTFDFSNEQWSGKIFGQMGKV